MKPTLTIEERLKTLGIDYAAEQDKAQRAGRPVPSLGDLLEAAAISEREAAARSALPALRSEIESVNRETEDFNRRAQEANAELARLEAVRSPELKAQFDELHSHNRALVHGAKSMRPLLSLLASQGHSLGLPGIGTPQSESAAEFINALEPEVTSYMEELGRPVAGKSPKINAGIPLAP